MLETSTYDDPAVVPPSIRARWRFAETGSAAAILRAVCPAEWRDILDVLDTFALDPVAWLRPGGNLGEVPKTLDAMFKQRGWCARRLDLVSYGLVYDGGDNLVQRLPDVEQEGYIIDNFKGAVAVDVEWNAKDGNLDRDLGAYRAWHQAGVLTGAVIITQDRLALKSLAKKLWSDYQQTLPANLRQNRLPIDVNTSTTTNYDKARLRLKRGAAGTCPVLIVAACEATWNGQPYTAGT